MKLWPRCVKCFELANFLTRSTEHTGRKMGETWQQEVQNYNFVGATLLDHSKRV